MKKKRSMLVILGALFLSLSVVGGASANPNYYYGDYDGAPTKGSGGGGIKPDYKAGP